MQAQAAQLTETQAALKERTLALSAAQQESTELRKENVALSKRVRALDAEVGMPVLLWGRHARVPVWFLEIDTYPMGALDCRLRGVRRASAWLCLCRPTAVENNA